MKRKGQMEIMGLTVIVILIILGMLFGLKVMSKPPIDLEQEFKAKSMSVNYLNVMLGTTSTCHKASFRELIQDCAQAGTLSCGIEGVGYLNSCDFVDFYFTDMLNQTLGSIKKKYHLHLEGSEDVQAIEIRNPPREDPCPGERTRGTQIIPSRRGAITIYLDLCA